MKTNRLLSLALVLLCVTISYGQSTIQKSGQPHLSPLAVDAAKTALTAVRQAIAEQWKVTSIKKEGKDCIDLDVALDEAETYLPIGDLKTEIRTAVFDYRFAERTRGAIGKFSGKNNDPEVAKYFQEYIDLALKRYPALKDKMKNSDDFGDQMSAAWATALNAATEHVKTASALLLEQQ